MSKVVIIIQKGRRAQLAIVYIFALIAFLFSLLYPAAASSAAKKALALCAGSVVPSLAAFIIAAKILIKSDFCGVIGKVIGKPMRKIFRVSAGGTLMIIVGLLSGFPMGAVAAMELSNAGDISPEEAESLLPYCNNAGPAFVIGAVGASMFGNPKIGVALVLAQTAAAITLLFATRGQRKRIAYINPGKKKNPAPLMSAVSSSVAEGGAALLAICAFVVFFCVFSDAVLFILSAVGLNKDGVSAAFIRGIFEITGGLNAVSAHFPAESGIVILISGFMLGSSGLSVVMQVADRAERGGISMKKYIPGKLIHGALTGLISLFICGTAGVCEVSLPFYLFGVETKNLYILAELILLLISMLSVVFIIIAVFIKIYGYFAGKCTETKKNSGKKTSDGL